MAKKKKKAAKEAQAAKEAEAPAAKAAAAPAADAGADEGAGDDAQDKFRAAAVVFFARDAKGQIDRILVAVEERKAQATYFEMGTSGKVTVDCIVFPMGRREKKDKADPVDTARREYIEETGDYGGLSKYLDVADFAEEDEEAGAELDAQQVFTGRNNLAIYFPPAAMVCLFCEVPRKALAATHKAAVGGVLLEDSAQHKAAEAAEAAEEAAGGPARKKRKREPGALPSPNYHVGKTDHLEPSWIDAKALRAALDAGGKAPVLQVGGKDCRVFPMVASVLRMPDVAEWWRSGARRA